MNPAAALLLAAVAAIQAPAPLLASNFVGSWQQADASGVAVAGGGLTCNDVWQARQPGRPPKQARGGWRIFKVGEQYMIADNSGGVVEAKAQVAARPLRVTPASGGRFTLEWAGGRRTAFFTIAPFAATVMHWDAGPGRPAAEHWLRCPYQPYRSPDGLWTPPAATYRAWFGCQVLYEILHEDLVRKGLAGNARHVDFAAAWRKAIADNAARLPGDRRTDASAVLAPWRALLDGEQQDSLVGREMDRCGGLPPQWPPNGRASEPPPVPEPSGRRR